MVQLLVDAGADLKAEDDDGNTVFFTAVIFKQEDLSATISKKDFPSAKQIPKTEKQSCIKRLITTVP